MATLIQYANGVPGIKFLVDNTVLSIGRSLKNDISLDDHYVSKQHAMLELKHDEVTGKVEYILHDLGSTNHTFVNKRKISVCRLKNTDVINIGQNEFRFSADANDFELAGATIVQQPSEHVFDINLELDEILDTLQYKDLHSLPDLDSEEVLVDVVLEGGIESQQDIELEQSAATFSDSTAEQQTKNFSRRLTFL